jgi:hypothetical protein
VPRDRVVVRKLALGTLVAVVLALVPSSVSASGGDDEVRKGGTCKLGGATWDMRVRTDDDQRIEVRGEVDHTASGKTWTWKIKHNGSVSASGRMVTRGGEFEVRRALVDLAGTDRCVFRAVQPATGEVCRGVIDW